jgi:prepilin-type N-terminal cleavage/methylation domain-containing protein
MHFLKNKVRSENGYSLVELMAVVAILGILTGLAVYAFSGVTTKADNQAAKDKLQSAYSKIRSNQVVTQTFLGSEATINNESTPGVTIVTNNQTNAPLNNNSITLQTSYSGGTCYFKIVAGQSPVYTKSLTAIEAC